MDNKNIKSNQTKKAKPHIKHQHNKNIKDDGYKISKQTIYLLLGILLLTVIAFSNSINGELLNWDDKDFITNNAFIKDFSIDGIKNIFTNIDKHDPIVAFTHAFTYHYWKLNPVPYHVLNLLFHLINVVLVFLLIIRLTNRNSVALVAALLFAIHPMRVESVAWISERKDVLFVLFYLASLIMYIDFIKKDHKLKYLLFALILFVCSLLSKLSAVTLPVVLVLINYYYDRKFNPKVIFFLVLFFILALIRGGVHYMSDITTSGNDIISTVFPLQDRIIFSGFSLMFYLISLFWFFNLCVYNPYPEKIGSMLPSEYYVYFVIALAVIALIIYSIYKYQKYRKDIIFGIMFFAVNIALVMHIIPFGGGVIIADRYSYLAYVGIFFIFGQIFYWLTDKSNQHVAKYKNIVYGIGVAYILIMFVTTFNRNTVWKTTVNVWTDAVEKYPDHFWGYLGLGDAYNDMGSFDDAMKQYNMAVVKNPRFHECYLNRGSLKFNHFKDYKAAIADFDKAIECNPNYVMTYCNRGLAKVMTNDMQGAYNDFNKAIKTNPNYPMGYYLRAKWNANNQKIDDALADYSKAISLNPNYLEAYNDRGIVYGKINKQENALRDFNQVIQIDPSNSEAFLNRGSTYFFMKDLNSACRDWNKAAQMGSQQAQSLVQQNCK